MTAPHSSLLQGKSSTQKAVCKVGVSFSSGCAVCFNDRVLRSPPERGFTRASSNYGKRERTLLQYILTAIAGIAIGVVAMRIWQSRASAEPAQETRSAATGKVSLAGHGIAQSALGRRLSAIHTRLTTNHVLAVAGVVLLAALAIFALRDDSGSGSAVPGSPAMANALPGKQPLDDVDTMISRLAARLEENPQDGEGFRMLGWSYLMTGKPELALAPYERALELLPNDSRVYAGYGEALAAMADNTVTPEARSAFERAVAIDPAEPRARYFLALWDAQNGHEQRALDAWLKLAASGPADAPWQADLRREIARVSDKLGIDVSDRLPPVAATVPSDPPPLDPTMIQSANLLPVSERQAMVADMVDRLATRLEKSPKDPDGWIQLLRSRMVLEQADKASADLASARAALADNASDLTRVNAAALEFGVPGA